MAMCPCIIFTSLSHDDHFIASVFSRSCDKHKKIKQCGKYQCHGLTSHSDQPIIWFSRSTEIYPDINRSRLCTKNMKENQPRNFR